MHTFLANSKYKMLKTYGISASKVLRKLTAKKCDGSVENIQIIDLPNDRFEDFMDFNMEYYVKQEITHRAAGIPNNAKAMDEYRQFVTSIMKNDPSHVIHVCCPERDGVITPEIVGASAFKLIYLDEVDYDTTQLKTKEVKKFYDILRRWNDLYPVPDIMRAHRIDTYYDDRGIGVRYDYRGVGLASTCLSLRRHICKKNGVPMTGAWTTSPGTEKASANAGWVFMFEISFDEISKRLGVTLENSSPKSYYVIGKPSDK